MKYEIQNFWRYGAHFICPSLPLEGVSLHDYEEHIRREHIQSFSSSIPSCSHTRSGSDAAAGAQQPQLVMENSSNSWTVYSSTQNLPAVLNDPR